MDPCRNLGPEQWNANLDGRFAELAIDYRQLESRVSAEDLEYRFDRGEMNAIVAAQAITAPEIGGAANLRVGDAQNFPRFPLEVEVAPQAREQRVVAASMSKPRKCGACLDVGYGVRSGQPARGDCLPNRLRLRFLDEQLYQSRGIQIQDPPAARSRFPPGSFRSRRCGQEAWAKDVSRRCHA
jgi:hypothetical protein